jgi:hypothetical protein
MQRTFLFALAATVSLITPPPGPSADPLVAELNQPALSPCEGFSLAVSGIMREVDETSW